MFAQGEQRTRLLRSGYKGGVIKSDSARLSGRPDLIGELQLVQAFPQASVSIHLWRWTSTDCWASVVGLNAHRVTPSGQFGVPYKIYPLVRGWLFTGEFSDRKRISNCNGRSPCPRMRYDALPYRTGQRNSNVRASFLGTLLLP